MDNRMDKALDWDSEISYEGPSYVTLPEGDYPFTITKFERKQYAGSTRQGGLPPCPMAEITVEARGKDGVSSFRTRLFLHARCEGILTRFFTCIGQRKHGDKLAMDWSKVEGSAGWARLKVRTFETRSGGTGTANEVDRWLAPDEAPQAAISEGEAW